MAKKRTRQDDDSDVEVLDAKRVRRDPDSVPPSPVTPPKQRSTKYGRKNQHVTIASLIEDDANGFDVNFDEIPKPKQHRFQTRAKAMKGKDGKVAPRPRPVATRKNKKQDEVTEAVPRKADVKVEDADKTLVEQMESHEVDFSLFRWKCADRLSV
jgi:hypothetical protein